LRNLFYQRGQAIRPNAFTQIAQIDHEDDFVDYTKALGRLGEELDCLKG
jgi:hypothetical protein